MALKPKGVGFIGKVRRKVYRTLDLTGINPNDKTAGPLLYAGSSSNKISSSTANTKFVQLYLESSATSGDNRGIYNRLYLSGAGGGGESFRAFTTITAACGTAHGSHISLNFAGDTTGSLSGLGVAVRGTLHIPDDAAWTSGTLSALQAEIYSDGAASDSDGLTELSFLRVVNAGNASGIADVDDDAFLISAQGFTVGAGNVFAAKSSAAVSHTARIKVGSTTYYIMLSDAQ
jgi:hypothetical protein